LKLKVSAVKNQHKASLEKQAGIKPPSD